MTLEDYRTLFMVCLAITIILIVVTAVLFFAFDVKKIISVKTGIAVKKGVKQWMHGRMKADAPLEGMESKSGQSVTKTVLPEETEETARLDIRMQGGKKAVDRDEFFEITETKTVI